MKIINGLPSWESLVEIRFNYTGYVDGNYVNIFNLSSREIDICPRLHIRITVPKTIVCEEWIRGRIEYEELVDNFQRFRKES